MMESATAGPTPAEPAPPKVTCPQCGSQDLREYGTTMYTQDITAWELDENGTPEPTNFGEHEDYIESDESTGIECGNSQCEWQGQIEHLHVNGRPQLEGESDRGTGASNPDAILI